MSSCNSKGQPKIRHQSKVSAYQHLNELQQIQWHELQVYRCIRCMYWHVGRRPATKKAKYILKHRDRVEEVLVGKLIGALKELINNAPTT